ncbi:tRNA (N6-isopentenyl adenosine(37)-C2)-methylthiotransferase MiaB [Rickettsiales bacterium]|nr:tRNA (N6-isopentenyl adenosine(37)-C2)-methylthiotransferase MiaB [Rickettsiales bacterium]MDB2550728.1 tRNA (N6-isopentenyl adenosine(37)-C2)-methylthiotransferase MiaB [Rickettsiales bacterium]
MELTKKLYIKTYGCQMNVYDSDNMRDLMASIGYKQTEDISEANMVIINTCHIREKATEKLYSDLGRVRKVKNKFEENTGDKMIVAVAGCVSQAEGSEIFRRSQIVDIIVGPESYQTLPDLVGRILRGQKKQIDLDFKPNNKFDLLQESRSTSQISNFVSIQEGCDKFCTFCVVPYTRGAEFSRNVEDIYQEAVKHAQNGTKEIYLLGQNVNAYHGLDIDGNNSNLAKLIDKISQIDDIKRIRYTTSHPRDMDDELISCHGYNAKLMPFLHLPIQSGSNNILQKMNRKHTRQDYFKIIEKLRQKRPDIGLSSDFIVGFPGETDQDFEDTLDLVEKIGFSACYSFKYSPRPGTVAADANNFVDEDIKSQRLQILQNLLNKQQIAFNQSFEGVEMPILFDKIGDKKGQIMGKSPWLQSVILEEFKEQYLGQMINVKIIKARPNSLIAKVV